MTGLFNQAKKMVFVSIFSFGLNVGIFTLFVEVFSVTPEISALVSIVFLMLINFFAFRYFIFNATKARIWGQSGKFILSSVGFRFSEVLIFSVVYRLFSSDAIYTYMFVLFLSFIFKFFFFGKFVFVNSR